MGPLSSIRSLARRGALAGGALALAAAAAASAGTIEPGGPLDANKPSFRSLSDGDLSPRVVRELPRVGRQALRSRRRRSLTYFAQLSDFQLADEESPARTEALDRYPSGGAAWRPQEALGPVTVDSGIRRLNLFTAASPNRQAGGARAAMDFALITGDQTDNQQLNESLWARQLIEGGQTVVPNSGTSDYSDCSLSEQSALASRPADEASRYTGVQDYDDYNGDSYFYDPDHPAGATFSSWPIYAGLMDRAQRPFQATGLRRNGAPLPSYVTNGNHDRLLQGAQQAAGDVEKVATGCYKPTQVLSPGALPSASEGFAVPPDPRRSFVDQVQLKAVYLKGTQADGHGFRLVAPAENAASGYSASYYAWNPKPGVRFISLDTVAGGGDSRDSFEGNIDAPQFRWLAGELAAAKRARDVVVAFGHHPIRSLTSTTPDEAARPCTGGYGANGTYNGAADAHGHDLDPGCDLDPRDSRPLSGGTALAGLFNRYPNVIAYFAGHIHRNRILACGSPSGCAKSGRGNWWELTAAATADWPQQNRLAEIMDNRDGTLSIVSSVLDQASPAAVPAPTSERSVTSAFSDDQLASLSRAFSFNEPQASRAGGPGSAKDRNVELLVRDPRGPKGAGRCQLATGRVSAVAVGRARLGRKRTTIRNAYSRTALEKRGGVDSFCLLGGGSVRAAYSRGRATLLLAAKSRYRVRGIKANSSVRTLRRRVKRLKRYRVGADTWYLARGSRARLVFRARRRRVREVGLADARRTATRKRALRFLRSF